MITSFEHVGLSVSNLERSIDFYCKHVNCKIIRIIEANPELKLGKVVGLNGCSARIAHLKTGDNMLELFQYVVPRGKRIPKNYKQADLGLIHVGFTSTNVRDDCRRMKENGVRFISEPVEFRPNVWICYFYGPDGEVCEIRES
jgi:glyoxylase I family protein